MIQWTITILALLLNVFCFSQNTESLIEKKADKEYYLIDSIDLEGLSKTEVYLLDSCLTIFHSEKEDSLKIEAVHEIHENLLDVEIKKKYNHWLHEYVLKKIKAKKSKPHLNVLKNTLANTFTVKAFEFQDIGNSEKALNCYNKGLELYKKLNNKKGISSIYHNMGGLYEHLGNSILALEYYHKSLKLSETNKYPENMSDTYHNLGFYYKNQNDLTTSLEYYEKSLAIRINLKNEKRIAQSYTNLAVLHYKMGDTNKVMELYLKAINIQEKNNYINDLALTCGNIGTIYGIQGNSKLAFKYYKKGLACAISSQNTKYTIFLYTKLARYNLKIDTPTHQDSAFYFGDKSFQLAKEYGYPNEIKWTALLMSTIFEKQKKGLKSLEKYKLYTNLKDSLYNESTERNAATKQAEYKYEKQKVIDDAENQKLLILERKSKEKKQILIYAITIGFFLVIIFLLILYRRFKLTQKQKIIIDRTNKELNTANDNYEMLLIESNHRIKNNLQMILSMLEYKALKSGKRTEELEKITGNIKAISSLHKHLSIDVHNPYVNLVMYLREIISLYKEFSPQNFEVKTDLKSIDIRSERIVYFGLLFNEMLSNTIEHSLNMNTKMYVSLKQEKDGYSFSYKDGSAWDNEKDTGMGTLLIPELVERVEGENYTLDNTQGLYYFEFKS